ncbi:hypothetical protein P8452_20505 [Trifolium repens]|nr:hypothetical protein P8452_20505 [Trifolium repens]
MREKVEREGVGGEGGSRALAERQREFIHNIDHNSTSFYFTNFPEDLNSSDLKEIFSKYGHVGDVYIPLKVDKWGKRFGFVKFKEVEDVEEMSRCLSDVWCGSFKLRINHSRFGRNDGGKRKMKVEPKRAGDGEYRPVHHDLSFREVVSQGAGSSGGDKEGGHIVKVPVDSSQLQSLKRSFVGFLLPEVEVRVIRTTLLMEGLQNISVTPMGGNMVLLFSTKVGELERMIKTKEEWLGYYFFKVRPWSPNMVNVKRELWVKVFGIPLHAWGDNLFKVVGARFGEFIDYDDTTASRARLDVARLKIATSIRSRIEAPVEIVVMGMVFELWVVEEEGEKRNIVVEEGVQGSDRSWGGSSAYPKKAEVACGEEGFYGEEEEEDDVSVDLQPSQPPIKSNALERDNSHLLEGRVQSSNSVDSVFVANGMKGVSDVDKGLVLPKECGAQGIEVLVDHLPCVPVLGECEVSSNVAGEDCRGENELGGGIINGPSGLNYLLQEEGNMGNEVEVSVEVLVGPNLCGLTQVDGEGLLEDPVVEVGSGLVEVPFEDVGVGRVESPTQVGEEIFHPIQGVIEPVLCGNLLQQPLNNIQEENSNLSDSSLPSDVSGEGQQSSILKKGVVRNKLPQGCGPKFLQLVEVANEGGRGGRRRRGRGRGGGAIGRSRSVPAMQGGRATRRSVDSLTPLANSEGVFVVHSSQLQEVNLEVVLPGPSPCSHNDAQGSDSQQQSFVPETPLGHEGENAQLLNEAKVILGIQKQVGFSFLTNDDTVLANLVKEEVKDRAVRKEREQTDGF